MKFALQILQPISAILLALLILVQNQGTGLSATFGGSGGFYATKRGAEKILSRATIVLAILFFLFSFLGAVVQ